MARFAFNKLCMVLMPNMTRTSQVQLPPSNTEVIFCQLMTLGLQMGAGGYTPEIKVLLAKGER
jgi:hypothetical protein